MKDGRVAMGKSIPDYDKAIAAYQAAQVAANECNLITDEPAKELKKVFNALQTVLNETQKARKKAEEEQQRSNTLAELAKAQAYANAAYIFCEKDPTIAAGFAMESLGIHKNTTAMIALLKAFNMNSWFYKDAWSDLYDSDISPDGKWMGFVDENGGVEIRSIYGKEKIKLNTESDNIKFLENGNVLTLSGRLSRRHKKIITLWNIAGEKINEYDIDFLKIAIADGKILVPAFIDKRIWLYSINATTGTVKKEILPERIDNLRLNISAGNGFTVVLQDFLNAAYLIDPSGKCYPISYKNYSIKDVDFKGGKFAFLLQKTLATEDRIDVGLLNTGTNDTSISIVPCKTLASGHEGNIKFLDPANLIVTTLPGESEIINLSEGKHYRIPGNRVPDIIVPFSNDSLFLLARRSGEVSIHNYQGKLVSTLLGNEPSDGLNAAFFKVVVTKDGKNILTVSRNGSRLWCRPVMGLTAQRTKQMTIDSLSEKITNYYKSFQSPSIFREQARISNDQTNLYSDNFGRIVVRFKLKQSDVFNTGLIKDIDHVFLSGMHADICYAIHMDDGWQRLLIMDPGIAFGIVKKEMNEDRIKRLNKQLQDQWVNTPEFNRKINSLVLVPVK